MLKAITLPVARPTTRCLQTSFQPAGVVPLIFHDPPSRVIIRLVHRRVLRMPPSKEPAAIEGTDLVSASAIPARLL